MLPQNYFGLNMSTFPVLLRHLMVFSTGYNFPQIKAQSAGTYFRNTLIAARALLPMAVTHPSLEIKTKNIIPVR